MNENIQQPIKNAPPFNLRTWARGDAITASRLNEPLRALQSITRGVAPPVQVTNRAIRTIAESSIGRFEVVRINGDYLECRAFDAEGNLPATLVNVAKPYLLREAVTERIVSGNTMTFDGIGTSYSRRQARITISGITTTETQRVVPSYVRFDQIFATFMPSGGTDVTATDIFDGTQSVVEWQDMNIDGRKWARET